MRKWVYAVGLGTLLVVVGLFATVVITPSVSHVVVVNHATENISSGDLTIDGNVYPFGAILRQQSLPIDFSFRGDADYVLSVEFESGNRLTQRLGYVTDGAEITDTVEITNSDMRICAEEVAMYGTKATAPNTCSD